MFLAIVFIVLGLFLLLQAMGIAVGINLWGFFWAIIFLAIGLKMLIKRNGCPMCSVWGSKMHQKMHGHCSEDECDCDCDCEDEDHGQN
jgi:predicted membrane protein